MLSREGTAENEKKRRHALRPFVLSAAIVCLCFLLTSTAWLTWEYHLMDQAFSRFSDLMTMGIGYAMQAAGLGAFAALLRRKGAFAEKTVPFALILHALVLIPALLSSTVTGTLISGFFLNPLCGYIAGYYLHMLAQTVEAGRRASALGIGYSASILLSWLLSSVGGGAVYYSKNVWLICLALTALTLALMRYQPIRPPRKAPAPLPEEEASSRRTLLLCVAGVVLLFSMVINSGFSFSSADLVQGVRVEFSRLFYAMGLLIAGFVTDRDRKWGAAAALSALVIPFMMLALRGEPVSLTVFWALNYFAYGFYSVFRLIVFSDAADKYGLVWLSGFGLLVGRLGDAIGEGVNLALAHSSTALVFLAALFFVAAVFLFFRVYRPLYAPAAARQQSERERFYCFSTKHDLSARERDMLRLLLEGKTNGEIAAALSISENTVKFHIRNLLQKTGCRNRSGLIALYMDDYPS